MNPSDALEALCEVDRENTCEDACNVLYAVLRRDWDVRVLDAWAEVEVVREWRCMSEGEAGSVELVPSGDISEQIAFVRGTLDAARHAAALAVFPSLTAEKQAGLGECP